MHALPKQALPEHALLEDRPITLAARYAQIRAASQRLAHPLTTEDCAAQSMPDASPVKWHLAHTTWFFEVFILERFEKPFAPFNPQFRMLFNSYYNGVGEKFTRGERGLLSRPALADILAYRGDVDARMARLLASMADQDMESLVELGLQHEQQHQELMLTDVLHLFSRNPLAPAYDASMPAPPPADVAAEMVSFAAGIVQIGHHGHGYAFDSETPRHRQFLEAYSLSSTLVTNGEYAEFIAAGGYHTPAFWLSDGWDWVQANGIAHPLYWRADAQGSWQEFSLHGQHSLAEQAPVLHVSFYEAAAYAAWAGARLPTEAEWEHAAAHPAMSQLFGPAWQWTSSSYAPYPGFVPAVGAVGEYNGKFMVNQYILRGASLATPPGHSRASYRNFFPATARWQFSGIRLAS